MIEYDDDEPDWVDGLAPDPLEVISIHDAAAECGVPPSEFIGRMVASGMLLDHPEGGWIAGPHPAIQAVER